MVLVCDGVTDVMTDQEVVDVAGEHLDDPEVWQTFRYTPEEFVFWIFYYHSGVVLIVDVIPPAGSKDGSESCLQQEKQGLKHVTVLI